MPTVQDVVVHVEPEYEGHAEGRAETALVLPALRAVAAELDLEIHDIGARWVDGQVHVEAHVTLDGELALGEAHERVSQLEREAQARIERLEEMVTHIEPATQADEPLAGSLSSQEIRQAVQQTLDGLPGCGTYHRIRVYPEGEDWAVSLHCLLDPHLPLGQAHAASSTIEAQLRNQVPRLSQVTVHMEPLSEPVRLEPATD
jgi:divalent metal cation (Fe/Co/Zn/Cd) transporter